MKVSWGIDETAKFKRKYNKDLTICGGSCYTLRKLPFNTQQYVSDKTRQRLEDLAPGAKLIFAPLYIIQDHAPPENIVT